MGEYICNLMVWEWKQENLQCKRARAQPASRFPDRVFGIRAPDLRSKCFQDLSGASTHMRICTLPSHSLPAPTSAPSSSGKPLFTLLSLSLSQYLLKAPQGLPCSPFFENQPGERSPQAHFIHRSHQLTEGPTAKDGVSSIPESSSPSPSHPIQASLLGQNL